MPYFFMLGSCQLIISILWRWCRVCNTLHFVFGPMSECMVQHICELHGSRITECIIIVVIAMDVWMKWVCVFRMFGYPRFMECIFIVVISMYFLIEWVCVLRLSGYPRIMECIIIVVIPVDFPIKWVCGFRMSPIIGCIIIVDISWLSASCASRLDCL